jgi:hypothetical protein
MISGYLEVSSWRARRVCGRLRQSARKRHKKRGAAGRGIEDTVMPRPNAGVHHDADGVVREMRRREICREPFTAHLRHKQRVEVRDPIVPFVIWKVRKKRADGGPGKALLDDSFAYLSGVMRERFSFDAIARRSPSRRMSASACSCSTLAFAITRIAFRPPRRMTRGQPKASGREVGRLGCRSDFGAAPTRHIRDGADLGPRNPMPGPAGTLTRSAAHAKAVNGLEVTKYVYQADTRH